MEYILQTNGLTKTYGSKTAADHINMNVRKGEIYGLIGRNGAGKTTILRMISGLSMPSEGDYSLFGKGHNALKSERQKVGALIEHPGIYPKLSAYDNLKLKCTAMGIKDKQQPQKLLELVGLSANSKQKAGAFSLGMRQRLGIALALVGYPELLILDEPINGLDPQGIAEMRTLLARLRDEMGITIIVSSHILDELAKIADAYGIIHNGKMVMQLTNDELLERCQTFVKLRPSDTKSAQELLRKMGYTDIRDAEQLLFIYDESADTAQIAKAMITNGIDIYQISKNQISLEQFYFGLTGGADNA